MDKLNGIPAISYIHLTAKAFPWNEKNNTYAIKYGLVARSIQKNFQHT
jgi:hypothetical protein